MADVKKYAELIWKMLVNTSSLYLAVWGIGKLSKDMVEASHSSMESQFGNAKRNFLG